jgi:ribosome-binding protein aMBF1 (putative translation factor)
MQGTISTELLTRLLGASPAQMAAIEMMKTKNNRGQAMRDARRRLGLTQLDLAERVGCTESLVTKIETGRATPEEWLKEAIASELGIQTWEVGV